MILFYQFIYELIKPYDFYYFSRFRFVLLCLMTKGKIKYGFIGPNVIVKQPSKLKIGNDVSIHANCYIDATGGITIGSNVSIAHNSTILSFEHKYSDSGKTIKRNELIYKEVVIEDDVWIGCGVRILYGIKIGTRVIIGANSVVKQSIASHSLAVGCPAKTKKYI